MGQWQRCIRGGGADCVGGGIVGGSVGISYCDFFVLFEN